MSVRVTQLSYNSGIMSGLMSGRADDTKYASGLQVCRNARCTPQGPIENRPGFMYVAETKYPGKRVRLIPFSYSTDQTMIIELGDKYARFHTQGKTLMKDGVPYEISTPWGAEDVFRVHYTQNAEVMTLVHPYYAPQELKRYSLMDWRLTEVSLVTALKPPGGVVATRISEGANDSNKDKYTQKYVVTALNDDRTQESEKSEVAECVANLFATGTTVKVSWEPVDGAAWYRAYKLQGGIYGYIGQTQELQIVDDNIAPETGETPPYTDDVFKVAKGIESVTVDNGGTGYVWANQGIADWTGGNIHVAVSDERGYPSVSVELYDAAGVGSGAVIEPILGQQPVVSTSITCKDGQGADAEYQKHTFNVYKVALTGYRVVSRGVGYKDPKVRIRYTTWTKFCKYMSLSTATVASDADVSKSVPILDGGVQLIVEDETGSGAVLQPVVEDGAITAVKVVSPGSNYTNPTIKVVSSTGSGAVLRATVAASGDYPAAVGYFEQRRIFAGSPQRPQNIWMTVTGTGSNMTYHLPLQDDDRISFAVASRDLNQIQHVIALQQLLVLTSAAEWRVSPLNSDAITPTSISVRPQSYVGASTVQPIMANNTAIYAAARGGHVREIAYNYNAGGYVTGDLSLRATELFDGKDVLDLAFSKEPFPAVWAVSTSGSLLGLTYVPEQQVGAWFEYTTQGRFESVAVVQEGLDDVIYTVTSRTINGEQKRFVECSTRRDDTSAGSGNYLDCSGVYTGEATAAIEGVSWLSGQEVTVNADGAVITGLTVSEDGVLTLPRVARRVVVGLPYAVEVQTMPIVAQVSDGSLAKGHTKNLSRVWLRLKSSAAPQVGPDFDNMAQVKTRTKETYGAPPSLITGVVDAMPPGAWVDDAGVCIRMDKPLPFTLISHSSEIEIGG